MWCCGAPGDYCVPSSETLRNSRASCKLRLQVEQLYTEGTELRTQVASMQQHQQRIEQELQDHRQQLAAYQQRWQTLAQPLSLAFTLNEPDALALWLEQHEQQEQACQLKLVEYERLTQQYQQAKDILTQLEQRQQEHQQQLALITERQKMLNKPTNSCNRNISTSKKHL